MMQFVVVTLAGMIAAATASAQASEHATTYSTARSVEQFGTCFVTAQDHARSAWSFVPRSNGGTFSNAGAKGVRSPYFLSLSDRGSAREVRLEPATSGAALDQRIARAVNQCI
jgi:hypothetical protein